MFKKKSTEKLAAEYAAIGVDNSKFTELGELNVLISTWANRKDEEDPTAHYRVAPIIYMPRKESTFQEEFDLTDEHQKADYLKACENALERYKMWQYLLQKHIDEIKTQGYPETDVYYPELDEYEN